MERDGPTSLTGKTLEGKYTVGRRIAAGSMGEVYEGEGPAGEPVALKILSAAAQDLMGEEARARFARECSITTELRHPNVVSVLGGGYDAPLGLGYLAMALMRGEDLERWLGRTGPLPFPVAARVIADAARGLAAAHARGIVHRDVKPANLFLHQEGEHLVVKVCDFGVSKSIQAGVSEITSTRSALGSPLYMSPEQLLSPKLVDHRADVWGLGMALYYALAGAPAFDPGITLPALAIALTSNGAPPLREAAPWVPEPVAAIVHRALSRDLAARWPTATAFADALEAYAMPGTLTAGMLVGVARTQRAPQSLRGAHIEPAPRSLPGVRLGRYELGELITLLPQGGLYAARRGATRCEIALFEAVRGARAEALLARGQAFQGLQGSLSVGVLEVGVFGEQPFIATEPPQGTPLSERLRSGPLDLPTAYQVFGDVAAALTLFHARGLVHGHVSPEVIFVGPNGRAKLGGLHYGDPTAIAGDEADGAQLADAPPADAARYMSPEQAMRSAVLTPATDLWSLCLCLHEAVSGKRAYVNAPSLGLLILMLCTQAVPSAARLTRAPARLRELIDAGLQRQPADRTLEIRTFARVLQELQTDDTDDSAAVPPTPTVRPPPPAPLAPLAPATLPAAPAGAAEEHAPRPSPALRLLPALLGAVAVALLLAIVWLLVR